MNSCGDFRLTSVKAGDEVRYSLDDVPPLNQEVLSLGTCGGKHSTSDRRACPRQSLPTSATIMSRPGLIRTHVRQIVTHINPHDDNDVAQDTRLPRLDTRRPLRQRDGGLHHHSWGDVPLP
jgi:hypothetical protein